MRPIFRLAGFCKGNQIFLQAIAFCGLTLPATTAVPQTTITKPAMTDDNFLDLNLLVNWITAVSRPSTVGVLRFQHFPGAVTSGNAYSANRIRLTVSRHAPHVTQTPNSSSSSFIVAGPELTQARMAVRKRLADAHNPRIS
jgi:hypothetical protein